MLLLNLRRKIKDWWAIQKIIKKALSSKGFFLTVSYKKKIEKNGKDLNHFWMTENFPTKAILPSLQTIFNDLDKKEIVFKDLLKSNKEKNNV